MKRFLTVLMAGLLIAAFVVPAAAWEFSMKGEYQFRLTYVSRTGDTDLFGNAALNNDPANVVPTLVGLSGPNLWRGNGAANFSGAGVRIINGGFNPTQNDALWSDSKLTMWPVIRVNPAIRVHGIYTVGGYRNKFDQSATGVGIPPTERWYMSQTSTGSAFDTAAFGSWEQFRATIQMPIGIFSIGVKDFPWGTGATFGYNVRSESFLLVLPYGPFRFLPAIWLARPPDGWGADPADNGNKADFFGGWLFTYDCGALNLGAGVILRNRHFMASEAANNGQDTALFVFGSYFKYNNGRFFAAAEYAFAQVDVHRNGVLLGQDVANAAPTYSEFYHFFSEAGAVAGPAKVRLMYAVAGGPVLNNFNPTKNYQGWAVNEQCLRPYQFLMFTTYAGGNGGGWNNGLAFYSDEYGQMVDAYALGGRADYAVASNLNLWASYLWAHRLEAASTYAGQFTLAGGNAYAGVAGATPYQTLLLRAQAAQAYKTAQGWGGNPNPYVDDGFVGWEVNVGADWKLLEGMNMILRYSYWQPGEWFEQAYRAVGYNQGAFSANTLITGRDAIQAIRGSFIINF